MLTKKSGRMPTRKQVKRANADYWKRMTDETHRERAARKKKQE
jgi:hypothetical protein